MEGRVFEEGERQGSFHEQDITERIWYEDRDNFHDADIVSDGNNGCSHCLCIEQELVCKYIMLERVYDTVIFQAQFDFA